MDMITLAMAKKYSDSKGGYVEPGKVLGQCELAYHGSSLESGEKVYYGIAFLGAMEVGKTYTVTIDGETHTGVCKELDGKNRYFGNPVVMGNDDNGEKYCVLSMDEGGVDGEEWSTLVCSFGGGTSATLAFTETIHPIDPKFIPGAVLPVVELSTVFKNGTQFTEEESALLTAAYDSGAPVVIKCDIDLGITYTDTCAVWGRTRVDTTLALMLTMGASVLQIYTVEGVGAWSCGVG